MGECQTYSREVMFSTPDRVAIKWLLLGWVTLQRSNPSQYIINTKVNSAFHPSGVGKSSTSLFGWC